jgi:hypothetical protein
MVMGNKILVSLLVLAAVLAITLPSCRSAVTFSDVTGNPSAYNGKTVTFEAYVFTGFEIQVLAPGLTPRSGLSGLIPAEPRIWITGPFPQTVIDRLYTQNDTPSGYPERYGKVRVTGTFQYGSKYGHMDAYQYQLVVSDAVLLDWAPS